jgi:lipoprotein-anchoring transpeptidase ErfK/SrfK
VVPPRSPENFLGTRWLGFNIPKYGIHGTIYPELIGQSVSGGCVRMRNEDVEELYAIIPVGTKVVIKDE